MSRWLGRGAIIWLLLLALWPAGRAVAEDQRLERAFHFAARGEKSTAADLLADYLQDHPQDQQTLAWYGEVQLDLLNLDGAIDALERAVAGRSDALALRELAEAYLLEGEFDKAEAAYVRLVEEMPGNQAFVVALEGVRRRAQARGVLTRYYRNMEIALFICVAAGVGLVFLILRFLRPDVQQPAGKRLAHRESK